MFVRAETIISAGHSVILDATFIEPDRRVSAQRLAEQVRVPFLGLWLDAPNTVQAARLRARTGDASDADTKVLDAQLASDLGMMTWHRIDAAGNAEQVKALATRQLKRFIKVRT